MIEWQAVPRKNRIAMAAQFLLRFAIDILALGLIANGILTLIRILG